MANGKQQIEFVELEILRVQHRNPRTHSKLQIRQIAYSIERFGFTSPILIDEDSRVLAGHARLAAARHIGMPIVPCLRLSMSDVEKKAYVIADNKLALNSGWDIEILAGDIESLIAAGVDVSLTGFEQFEIDKLLLDAADASPVGQGPEDEHPTVPPAEQAVSRIGGLWLLGRHRLLCGDAKEPDAVKRLMDGQVADMVFLDPPYNVPIMGHVTGLGRARHREFVEASGELTPTQFVAFLKASFEAFEAACRNGAIVFICMDWRHIGEAQEAAAAVFGEQKNLCIWVKSNAGMGTFYRSQHELIMAWKIGDAPHTNNFGLGDKGRHRSNVWVYPGVNTFKVGRAEELALHPTVKPVALVADAIRDVSDRGQIVLDTFGGSGTTLIAAERTGRAARLIELDPSYCDVIVRRWERLTGKVASLDGTDQTFEDLADERLSTSEQTYEEAAA